MKRVQIVLILLFVSIYVSAQPYPDSQRDGKYALVNGAKLWVVEVGKGDPLFIIPGGPGGSHIGYRDFDAISSTNRIVYFDAFGRGKSDTAKDVKEYSLDRDIEDLEGLRLALHYDKINVL